MAKPKKSKPRKRKQSDSSSRKGESSQPTEYSNTNSNFFTIIDNDHFIERRWIRRAIKIFLGPFIGVLLTFYIYQPQIQNNVKQFEFHATWDNLYNILDQQKLPSGSFEYLSKYVKSQWGEGEDQKSLPGYIKANEGTRAHFPIVMIPGITSTGLELWKGNSCADSDFRKRLWGTLTMAKFLMINRACWLEHLMLDVSTGVDPENIKLRPAQGLEGADYLLPGFWVWGKLIENFAAIGYDSGNMYMATYDWRLSIENVERRDGYYTKLKKNIEALYDTHQKKVVVMAHSMGSGYWLYFMKTVSDKWVEKHIESFINIGGPLLGVPKAISSLVSGEMKDTALLGYPESFILESILSRKERADLFRSWGSMYSMLPRGGDFIWKEISSKLENGRTTHDMVYLPDGRNLTAESANNLVLSLLPKLQRTLVEDTYNVGGSIDPPRNQQPKDWTNPMTSTLPNAPSMTIYCFYGIGKDTERSYVYTDHDDPEIQAKVRSLKGANMMGELYNSTHSTPLLVNVTYQDKSQGFINGVQFGDGDGTVPLVSLGYMCNIGYKDKKYNPAMVPVITREFDHRPVSMVQDIRGGKNTGDHVDILGNYDMTLDILDIVSNARVKPKDNIVSLFQNIL
jgi:phospholipid:diacylglycerol acyltransferase